MDIHRPLFLRSQSDNSSTTTIITSHLRTLDEHNHKVPNTIVGPRRPPRNPARTLVPTNPDFEPVPVARALTGSKEEVTPWELEPFPETFSEVETTSPTKTLARPSSSGGNSHGPGISLSDFYLLRRKSTGSHKSSKAKAKTKAPPASLNAHPSNVNNTHTTWLHKQRVAPSPGVPPPLPSPSPNNSSSPNLTSNGNVSPRITHRNAPSVPPHPNPRHQHSTFNTAGSSHTTTPPPLASSRSARQSTLVSASRQPLPSKHNVLSKPSTDTTITPETPPLPAPETHKSHSKSDSDSPKSSLEHHADHRTNNLKFSTADRTILEELKRNISAREAQFVVKGPYTNSGNSKNSYKSGYGGENSGLGIQFGMGGLVGSGSRKHHPFKKEEVPYPRSYDREVLDLDVWETLFYHQICESLTWHVFDVPPTKVLDIGCGTGSWILDCARVWRNCHFVGLDIVPVQPDLQQVGSADLAHRVTWVQGNFLEGLPFPNEEFDFVHIKRISLGVPEDKWDPLFEEISRVMKPGAAFEMIEEDLLFPGAIVDPDDDKSNVIEESTSQLVDNAYFSDSEVRRQRHSPASSSSSSYFQSSSETRSRPRSSSSVTSTSTATGMAKTQIGDKSARRRSVPTKGDNRRRSTNYDFGAHAVLMGLGDGGNDLVKSEREDGGSDRDPTSSASRRNSLAGDQNRMQDDLLVPSSADQAAIATRASPILPTLSLASSALSTSTIAKYSTSLSTTVGPIGKGLEVGAIVEDEEGEENAVLNDRRNDRQTDADAEHPTPSPSHLQYPTDSTITPSKLSHSKLDTSSVLSKSTLLRHPPSASTGSITDLHNASPYSFNPYAKLDSALAGSFLPPKRPLSPSNHGLLTNSSIHLPSLSFSQSVNSLSSNSPRSSTVVIGEISYESKTEANDSHSTINGAAAPFLLRTLPKSPVNPRDHSILELIYNEMNAARFVNLSPLSLLPNLLGLYFQDLRTHPPVIFTFPPKSDSVKPSPKRPTLDSDPDEDARDAIRPRPQPVIDSNTARGRTRSMSASSSVSYSMTGSPTPSRTSHFEDATGHWVNMKQIVKRESPYIIYDDLRISAVSPSTRASILSPKKRPKPSSSTSTSVAQLEPGKDDYSAATHPRFIKDGVDMPRGTSNHKPVHDLRFRLPNTTLNIDIRSLNLHLALRVTEILACSETMWEWVLEYQEQERVRSNRRLQETKHRTRSRSIGPLRPSSRDKTFVSESIDERLKTVLVDMTREDFDDMLRRFYSDMQDSMALPAVLEERFGWTNYPAPPSAERQAFEAECEKYQQWEAEQRTRKKSKFMSDQAFRQQTESPLFASPISITDPSSILSGLPASRAETKSHTKEHQSVSSTATFVKPQPNASLSAGSTAPPSQRISRSLRIFVAWKGADIS
ncbi:hypothetical protein C8R42DRAFT_631982 [Lentinula raphanica]|nr:hypothetical protein C8R42DRAFT_631982 [Lentinula raphanica]